VTEEKEGHGARERKAMGAMLSHSLWEGILFSERGVGNMRRRAWGDFGNLGYAMKGQCGHGARERKAMRAVLVT